MAEFSFKISPQVPVDAGLILHLKVDVPTDVGTCKELIMAGVSPGQSS